MSDQVNYTELFSKVATWQGAISYGIFSIYVVQPEAFYNVLGGDPGAFLLSNMFYGQTVHIYTRPAMRKLKTCFRMIYSVYGSYSFNFTSLMVFFAVAESFQERPVLGCIVSYCMAEIMYALFHSYLYFVDICAYPTTSARFVFYDMMFNPDT